MKQLKIFVAIVALLTAGVALARSTVPVVNVDKVPVTTGSGKAATVEAVRKAIIDGGAAGARKWFPTVSDGGKSLRLTYNVRSHSISVNVYNTADSYSLVYADSLNMKHAVENGVPMIHPFYNKWVQELRTAIDFELRKL
jgi:hypothetical protein